MMKILIVDDHGLFRDGMAMRLGQIAPNAEVFQADNYTHALSFAELNLDVDLVVLDLDMPDMCWKDGFSLIKSKLINARFVVVSASENIRDIKKCLEMGACGFIPKRVDTKILSSALALIIDGGTYIPPSLINILSTSEQEARIKSDKLDKLTSRQEQVLLLISEGKSNKQIAYELDVSEATVKLHVNALLRLLGATNRTQAVHIAQEKGFI